MTCVDFNSLAVHVLATVVRVAGQCACTEKVRLCRTVLPVQKSLGLMAVTHSNSYPFVWLSHEKTSGAMMIKELFTESYTLAANCSACIDMFHWLTFHLVTKYYTSLFSLSHTKGKSCSHSGPCLGEVLWRGRSRPKGADEKSMCRILPGLPPQRDLSPHCWFIRTSESVEGTRMEPGGWQYRAMIYRLDYHHGNGNPNHINQTFVGSRRLCVYKTYIWLYLTQFTSQVIILSS